MRITYTRKKDGSVCLKSLRGITPKALKQMSDEELKSFGLFRDFDHLFNPKFFEIPRD